MTTEQRLWLAALLPVLGLALAVYHLEWTSDIFVFPTPSGAKSSLDRLVVMTSQEPATRTGNIFHFYFDGIFVRRGRDYGAAMALGVVLPIALAGAAGFIVLREMLKCRGAGLMKRRGSKA